MRRPRGPGGRFLTADEVAEMERHKKELEGVGDNEGGNGQPTTAAKGKETDKSVATRTPNRPPHGGPHGSSGGSSAPTTGGSLKRKAGQAGLSTGSPLKKTKSGGGGGRVSSSNLNSESDEDGLASAED
jgi:hypothetical protein